MIHGIEVFYHAVEKYPLTDFRIQQLNYENFISQESQGSLTRYA